MINSPAHAIELLGGSKAVADRLQKRLTTVSSWAARQSIPIEWWEGLIGFARDLGLAGFDYATLAQAHVAAKRGDAAAATGAERAGATP